jgi:hypothetical protein
VARTSPASRTPARARGGGSLDQARDQQVDQLAQPFVEALARGGGGKLRFHGFVDGGIFRNARGHVFARKHPAEKPSSRSAVL